MVPFGTESFVEYIGNDSSSVFSITFPTFEASNVVAKITDDLGDETLLIEGVDYTLSNIGRPNQFGSLTLLAGNLATDHVLKISFSQSATQPAKLRNFGALMPEQLERIVDRLAMFILAISQGIDTTITQIIINQGASELRVEALETHAEAVDLQLADHENRITTLENTSALAPTLEHKNTNFAAGFNHIYITSGTISAQLPEPVIGKRIEFKLTGTDDVTLLRFGSETIDGVAANKVLTSTKQSATIINDGTNWFLI
jgi:hypothetical protein